MTQTKIQQLTVDILADRARHLSSISYTNAAALVKSAVVVVSAATVLSIWKSGFPIYDIIDRMLFWVLSAMLAGITQITWVQGYLLLGSRIGILDFFAPIWVGMFEVLLFMICDPGVGQINELHVGYSVVWLLAAGGHLLSCAILVGNRLYLHSNENFDQQLRETPIDAIGRSFSKYCKAWILNDGIGAFSNACIMFAAFGIAISGMIVSSNCRFYFTAVVAILAVFPTFVIVSVAMIGRIRIIERIIDRYYF